MSLDDIIKKLPSVKVTIVNEQKTKEWLFEYGCKVSEAYNLNPKTHVGFVKYCGILKLAQVYVSAQYACEDPGWKGITLEFHEYPSGPKSIKSLIKKEYKCGQLPTRQEYLDIMHKGSTPLGGEFYEDMSDV